MNGVTRFGLVLSGWGFSLSRQESGYLMDVLLRFLKDETNHIFFLLSRDFVLHRLIVFRLLFI